MLREMKWLFPSHHRSKVAQGWAEPGRLGVEGRTLTTLESSCSFLMAGEHEIQQVTWPRLTDRMWDLERVLEVTKLNLLIFWVMQSRFGEAGLSLRHADWGWEASILPSLSPFSLSLPFPLPPPPLFFSPLFPSPSPSVSHPISGSSVPVQTVSPLLSWTARLSELTSVWLTVLGRLLPGASPPSKEGRGVSDGELSLSVRTLLVLRDLPPQSRKMWLFPRQCAELGWL